VHIKLNENALEWFEDRNISFHSKFGIRLKAGDYINFHDNIEVEPYIGIHGGNTICSMGFMSYTNSSVPENFKIGRYCSVAWGLRHPAYRHPVEHISTSIFTHDQPTDLVVRFVRDNKVGYDNFFPAKQKGGITLGHDVWIGQDVSIMPGLTIGTGAVVAANSVVTKSVMPYEIVGGNPAKQIKMRFSNEIINRLLLSEWWNYKFTDFDGINISNPVDFLGGFEKIKSDLSEYRPEKIKPADVASLCD
jgi:virginiamycin A acetyltransferase